MRLAKSCHLWHCCDISLGGCGRCGCDRCDRWAFISPGSLGIPRPHFHHLSFLTVGLYKVSGLCNSGHSPWPSIYWRWTWIQCISVLCRQHIENLRESPGISWTWWLGHGMIKFDQTKKTQRWDSSFPGRPQEHSGHVIWRSHTISIDFKHFQTCRSVPNMQCAGSKCLFKVLIPSHMAKRLHQSLACDRLSALQSFIIRWNFLPCPSDSPP